MIDGERVRLRGPLSKDFELLGELRSNEEIARLLASRPRGGSPEKARQWADRLASDSSALLFVIADVTSDAAAGYIQVTQIDLVSRRAMFGICVAPQFQGRGMAAESLRLLESYLQRVWNLQKLVLEVLAGNDKAVALYKRHGFREVGVLANHFYFDDAYEDVILMEHVFG